jgi:hypothetical protein
LPINPKTLNSIPSTAKKKVLRGISGYVSGEDLVFPKSKIYSKGVRADILSAFVCLAILSHLSNTTYLKNKFIILILYVRLEKG